MATKRRHTPKGKKGGDGLTDRERAFVAIKRRDPSQANCHAMREAGFRGTDTCLSSRAGIIMKRPEVMRAICAPLRAGERPQISDAELREEIRLRLRDIVRGPAALDADVIRACDKLLATIVGGYVPVQVKTEGTMTLEGWVRAMGGAPADGESTHNGRALPAPEEEH